MTIFFNFSLTSNHLHTLQVENCDSNSRLVVDENDNGKFRLERVNWTSVTKCFTNVMSFSFVWNLLESVYNLCCFSNTREECHVVNDLNLLRIIKLMLRAMCIETETSFFQLFFRGILGHIAQNSRIIETLIIWSLKMCNCRELEVLIHHLVLVMVLKV